MNRIGFICMTLCVSILIMLSLAPMPTLAAQPVSTKPTSWLHGAIRYAMNLFGFSSGPESGSDIQFRSQSVVVPTFTDLSSAEILVTNSLSSGRVEVLDDDSFYMVWTEYNANNLMRIYIDYFNGSGIVYNATAPTNVPSDAGDGNTNHYDADVTVLGDGRPVVVYTRQPTGNTPVVYCQVLTAQLPFATDGDRIVVSPGNSMSFDDSSVAASASDPHGFVVVWRTLQSGTTNQYTVNAQMYTRSPLTGETATGANLVTVSSVLQMVSYPSIITLQNGNYLVAYAGWPLQEDTNIYVFGRLFDSNFNPLGDEVQLSATGVGNSATLYCLGSRIAVAPLDNGGFVVGWASTAVASIVADIFDMTATRIGSEIIVAPFTCASSYRSGASLLSVTGLPNSGFMVTWLSNTILLTRRYTPQAASSGLIFQVDGDATVVNDTNDSPILAQRSDSNVLLTFRSNTNIAAKVFPAYAQIPVLTHPFNVPNAFVGVAMNYSFPTNVFVHPYPLQFLVQPANINPWPTWLTFISGGSGMLIGTPLGVNSGETDQLSYIAYDNYGGANNANFNITVVPSFHFDGNFQQSFRQDSIFALGQEMSLEINSQVSNTATVSMQLLDLTAGTLSAPSGFPITPTFVNGLWTVTGAIVDIEMLMNDVYYVPSLHYNDNFNITLTVNDGINLPKTQTIVMLHQAAQGAPQVLGSLPDLSLQYNQNIAIYAPKNLFSDPDGNQTLSFLCTELDTLALPSWLQMSQNATTIILTGRRVAPIPSPFSATILLVTATDITDQSVSISFTVSFAAISATPFPPGSSPDATGGSNSATAAAVAVVVVVVVAAVLLCLWLVWMARRRQRVSPFAAMLRDHLRLNIYSFASAEGTTFVQITNALERECAEQQVRFYGNAIDQLMVTDHLRGQANEFVRIVARVISQSDVHLHPVCAISCFNFCCCCKTRREIDLIEYRTNVSSLVRRIAQVLMPAQASLDPPIVNENKTSTSNLMKAVSKSVRSTGGASFLFEPSENSVHDADRDEAIHLQMK